MQKNNEIEALIEMLNKFITKKDCSLQIAGEIEVKLDELFPDDDTIQDAVTYFALYRPGGGEFLYDEMSMIQESKLLLEILK